MLGDRKGELNREMTQLNLESWVKSGLILCQSGLPGLDGQKPGVEKVNARVANIKELQPLFPSL